jgi:MFS family permease
MARSPLATPPFLLCAGANFLQSLAFNLYLHLPGFLHDLGADEVRIGVLSSLTALAAIAARPPVGRVMDGRGRRPIVIWGGVLNTIVCLAYLSIDGIGPALVLVRVAHGLAEAALFSSLFTMAADLVPADRRTEGIALYGVSGIVTVSFGGLVGDFILARAGYDALFATSAGLAAGSFVLSLPLRDRRPAPGVHGPSRGFTASVSQRDLVPLWFLGMVFATALSAVFTFVKTFVLETGIGTVGLFFSAYAWAAVGLRLFFAWLPERIGPKRALFPALGALATGLAGLALADDAHTVAAAGALCGLGHGFTFPILSGLVVERAREAERGAALSLFTALFDAGVFVGGPGFGALIGVAGYAGMCASASALVVVGAVAFAPWDRAVLRARAAAGGSDGVAVGSDGVAVGSDGVAVGSDGVGGPGAGG